jgi:N-acetylneuraminic acid mutarotase
MNELKRFICCINNNYKKNKSNYNLYNDNHKKWICLENSGNIPSERSGHESIIINNKMYLFGGVDNYNCFLNDLFEFNLDTHIWKKINYKNDAPNIRASFAMCKGFYDNTILLCGGATITDVTKDLYEFNTRTKIWTKLYDNFTLFYGLSISLYKNSLLVFGGTKGIIFSNQLFEYNLITNEQKEIITSGDIPTPRYKHQAIISDNYLYIIGGGSFKPINGLIDVYKLNINTLIWKKIKISGKIPICRAAHTCQLDTYTKNIIIFGGFDHNLNRLNDYYLFDIIKNKWIDLNDKFNNNYFFPSKRSFSSSCFYNNGFYIICGSDSNKRYNDIWNYQFRSSPPSLTILCSIIIHNIYNKNDILHLNIPDELKLGILTMNKYSTNLS